MAQTWREWARIGEELTEQDWRRPTRCEPWRVADLYAHHSAFPVVLAAPAPAPATEAALLTAVDVLRGLLNVPGGIAQANAPEVADRAVAESAAHSPAELVERFAATGPEAISALRGADPEQPVPWAICVVTLTEALRIALLEATVHLLDLQRTSIASPTVPDGALRETVLLLAELAPSIEPQHRHGTRWPTVVSISR